MRIFRFEFFRLFLFLLFCVHSSLSKAQTKSDEIKYYILFDNSGSMKALDPYNNLQKLLSEFVGADITGNKVSSNNNLVFSFDIRVFGEAVSRRKEFKISNKNTEAPLKAINKFLGDQFENTSKEQFTNINEALLSVQKSIDSLGYGSSNNKDRLPLLPSTGLIIFSDGKFENGDFSNTKAYKDIEEYKGSFFFILNGIEINYGIPTFFVTTAGNPIKNNNFIPSPWDFSDVLNTDSMNFVRKNKEFWVNWQMKIGEEEKTKAVLREFDMFKVLAHNKILTGISNQKKTNDEVDVAFIVEELLKLSKDGQKLDFNKDTSLENQFTSLVNNVKAEEKDLFLIHSLLKSLVKKGDGLNDLLARERAKAYREVLDSIEKGVYNSKKESISDAYRFSLLSELATEPIEAFELINKEVTKIDSDLESEIIAGFSDYLIERVKMEAVFAFFDNLKGSLSGFKIDEYFQRSWEFLEDPNNYTDFASLHKVVKVDLNNLPMKLISDSTLVMKSQELVALHYFIKLTEKVLETGSLESAFSSLGEQRLFNTNTYKIDGDSSLQKAILMENYFLLISDLIGLLENHDLISFFNNQPENKESFNNESLTSMLLSIGFYKDKIENVKLELFLKKDQLKDIQSEITELYDNYNRLKAELQFLVSSSKNLPVSDYKEFRSYRALLITDMLKRTNQLFISSEGFIKQLVQNVKLDSHPFDKKVLDFFKDGGAKERINDMMEFYFLIRKRDYEEAIVKLQPYLFDLISLEGQGHIDLRRNFIRNQMFALSIEADVLKSSFKSLDDIKKEKYETRRIARNQIENSLSFSADGIPLRNKGWPSLFFRKKEIHIANHWLKKREEWISSTSNTIKIGWKGDSWSNKDWRNLRKFVRSEYLKNELITNSKSENFTSSYETSFRNGVDRFVSIASQTASAKNSGEVQDIISRNSLPVASYKIKREREQSIMASAYVGFGLTYYHKDGVNIQATISAPVGFEYTFRTKFFINYKSSVSLMATIFDVGNVIDYRVSGDDSEEKFALENIVSPGFIASIGFSHKLPLSLNLGYLFNPNRAVLSLNFDLPLFHIWSKK